MYSVTFRSLPKSIQIFLGVINLLCIAYLASIGTPATIADMTNIQIFELVYMKWLAVIFGVLSFWRIGFMLLPFCYMHWYKGALNSFFQMSVTATDYFAVIEGSVFVLIGIFIFKYIPLIKKDFLDSTGTKPIEAALLVAIAAHFSNYFYSGLQKLIVADWSLTAWITENETQNIAANAIVSGHSPLSISNDFAATITQYFSQVVDINNFLILVAQLLSVVLIMRIRTTQWLTFFYDITHTVIFLVTGIFFYKWIIYNFTIIAALRYVNRSILSTPIALFLVLVVLLAPYSFYIVRLGWFDSKFYNDEYFTATTSSGEEYRLPTNYFLNASVTHAQQRIHRERGDAFENTGAFGNTHHINDYYKFDSCEQVRNTETKTIPSSMTAEQKAAIQSQLDRIHNIYLEKETDTTYSYNTYPHHIFSMPWSYEGIENIMKKDITSYTYHVDGLCVEFVDGEFIKHKYAEMEQRFDVKK